METVSKNKWYFLLFFFPVFFAVNYQGGEFYWIAPASISVVLMLGFGLWFRLDKSVYFPNAFSWKVLWLFLLWSCISTFWSVSAYQSLLQSYLLMLTGVMGFIYFFLFYNKDSWRLVWISVLLLGLFLCLLQLIQFWNGIARPPSLFINPNTFAAFLNLIILPTVGIYFLAETKASKYYLAALSFLLLGFFLTGGRGALLGQIVGLGVFFLLLKSRVNKKTLVKFLIVYVAAFAVVNLLNNQYLRGSQDDLNSISNSRVVIWKASVDLLENTPWYGNGLGTYWLQYPQFRYPEDKAGGQNAHNDYLQFAIEVGYPGIALFLLFIGSLLVVGYKKMASDSIDLENKKEASGILAGLIAIGVHSLFTFNMGVYSILLLTGLLLGRFYGLTGQVKEFSQFSMLGIRKNLARGLIFVIALILSLGFLSLSAYAYYLNSAQKYYSEGKIEKADEYNAKAIAINPYDDRSYLVYVEMYIDILDLISELDISKKQFYFEKALSYLERAREINPYRDVNYLLNAQLLEVKPKELGTVENTEIIGLYQQALKVNPNFLPVVESLAKFYLRINRPVAAKNVIIDSLKWYFHDLKREKKFFEFAEPVIQEFATPDEKMFFHEKKIEFEERYSKDQLRRNQ